MNINKTWKQIKISDYFVVSGTKTTGLDELSEYGAGIYPYVTTQAQNNGVSGYYDHYTERGNVITIDSAVLGYSTYQEYNFSASDHVEKLTPKFKLNRYIALFFVTLLNKEMYRYCYGRKCNQTNIKNTCLKVPVTLLGEPDWQYMEDYIKSLISKKLPAKALHTDNISHRLKSRPDTWKDFIVGTYFDVKKGKRLTAEDQTEGTTPYIGAIDSNNGVANYIGQEAIHSGNTISLSYNGSVGEAYYQPVPFWATDDVNVLYPKTPEKFNKYNALFICSVLRHEKYRFNYGRKWVLEKMKSAVIKLPATASGEPDWQYMEDYIKSLPYGDRI